MVGEQPVLPPAAAFEYESACPLRAPTGSMEGEFEFVVLEDSAAEAGEDAAAVAGTTGREGGRGGVVQAEIGRFGLGPA